MASRPQSKLENISQPLLEILPGPWAPPLCPSPFSKPGCLSHGPSPQPGPPPALTSRRPPGGIRDAPLASLVLPFPSFVLEGPGPCLQQGRLWVGLRGGLAAKWVPPCFSGPQPWNSFPLGASWQEPWHEAGPARSSAEVGGGGSFLNLLPSPAASCPRGRHSHSNHKTSPSWSHLQENGKIDLRKPLPQVANLPEASTQDPRTAQDSEVATAPPSTLHTQGPIPPH